MGRQHRRTSTQRFRAIAVGVLALGSLASLATLTPNRADASVTASRGVAVPAKNDGELAPHRSRTLLVAFEPGASASDRIAARGTARATKSRRVSPKLKDTEVLTLATGDTVTGALKRLRGQKGVRYAEPDYLLSPAATSDDSFFTAGSLWGMYGGATTPSNAFGSNAAAAWGQGYTGSSSVAVGIIDEGIQFAHPDLATNIWTNPGEIAGNGIDDDGNGYIDDVHGWDFLNGDGSVYDGNGTDGWDTHGTHVAGTIGGVGGNGQGVAGVNWSVTLVSAKFLGVNGGYTSDAVAALDYLRSIKRDKGLNIVTTSNSWGGGGYSSTLATAIENAGDAGMLFVAAAGNSANDNDANPSYPSNYECTKGGTRGYDCVIAVAAITSAGALSSFSSFGATTVDIGAPGSSIVSTYPDNSYASLSGTSMATPHVSGAVALCASINPALTPGQLRDAVVNSARATGSLSGKVMNSGRLDIGAMVTACKPATAAVSGPLSSLAASNATWSRLDLSWTDGVANEQNVEVQRAPYSGSTCGTYTTLARLGAGNTSYTAAGLAPLTSYCFRVRATNTYGAGTSVTSSEITAATIATPKPYTCVSTPYQWVGVDAGTTTSYTLGDDASAAIALPFDFMFYGDLYSTAQVSSNGFLRLGTGAATAYGNTAIPNSSDPNNYIAPWWDDLNPAAGGTIWSVTTGTAPNRRFVVTWSDVQTYGLTNSGVTFQLLLDEATSDVLLQYQDTTTGSSSSNDGAAATLGLEVSDGSIGTQIGFLQKAASASTAYRCTTGSTSFPSVTTSTLAAGTVGTQYGQTLEASGGTAPYTWSISSGSVPAGLQLNSGTGEISGIPTAAGTSSFTVKLLDGTSTVATKSLSITVANPVSVTTSSLPGGTVGTSYSQTLAGSGGTGSYTWAVTSGALPTGLALTASSGKISGTPSAAGTFNVVVTATDTAGRTGTKALSIVIAVTAPASFSKSSPSNNATSRPRSGLVLSWAASTGAASYEYCVDSTRNGVCNSSWVSVGSARTATISGLGSKVTYEWQVRAVNPAGTRLANNGSWWKFTTTA